MACRLWSARITRKAEHVPGIGGFGCLLLGLWMKARLEERWLTQELGEAAYGEYRRRVPMLLPFGRKG